MAVRSKNPVAITVLRISSAREKEASIEGAFLTPQHHVSHQKETVMRSLYIVCLIVLCTSPCLAAGDFLIYSGAGLMKPMEKLRNNFEQKHQISIDVHYAGSGEIFGLLSAGRCCDVFIPGAEKYTQDALKNGWIEKESIRKIVRHIPVIAAPAENPANIQSLEDLARPGLRLALGDIRSCAIGKLGKKILEKNNLYEQVVKNTKVYGPTVNQLLIYTATGRVDATIIWEDMVSWAKGQGKIKVIHIDENKNIIKTIPTAVTTCSKQPNLARAFNMYITSEEGLRIWEKWGFEPCSE
jgi:molybdate transport system substrate-binding protein